MTRIPVTILTGFLGAGKTTFLNRLMSERGFGDTAVIVNEFGAAGIDGSLVARADERAVEMTTGCLCCTVSGDVRLTLQRLLDEADRGAGPSFSRVVIETTGLADPLPLLQTFMGSNAMLNRFVLNGMVTLVDTVFGADVIERFKEAQRQVAVADLLLVTKSDLALDPVSRRDLEKLKRLLAQRNPTAPVRLVSEATADTVFSLPVSGQSAIKSDPAQSQQTTRTTLAGEHGGETPHGHDRHHDHAHDVNQHGDAATAFCFSANGPVDPQALEHAIETLQASFGVDLLRIKGLVEIAGHPGRPREIHVVGHLSSPQHFLDAWPSGIERTRMVMIVGGPRRNDAPGMLMRLLPGLTEFISEPARRAIPVS